MTASSRRKGRGRLSSIDMLPLECSEDVYWLRAQLTARIAPQWVILEEFNSRISRKGQAAISKSAFGRFSVNYVQRRAEGQERHFVMDAQRQLLADAGFVDAKAAHEMVLSIGAEGTPTEIIDAGFADRRAAHDVASVAAKSGVRAFHAIFGAREIGQQHLDANGGEVTPAVLQALHLAAGNVRSSVENERVSASRREDVGHHELLQRVDVLLHLIQALFDRLGQGANPPLVTD